MSGHATSAITRDDVLGAIRTAPSPPTVEEIAHDLGLHPNSVRLHAAALRDAGLITQENRTPSGRGRPQVVYRTTARGAWTGPRDYQLLASLLLSELARGDGDAAATARRMGRSWGHRIAGDRPGSATRERVVSALDELGFEPAGRAAGEGAAPRDATAGDEVELRNCPFRELVDRGDGVVCALHAGMLDGLADDTGGHDRSDRHDRHDRPAVELVPFTSPRACTVRFSPG